MKSKLQPPTSKLQRSSNIPIPRDARERHCIGSWCLGLLWRLDLGAWCFILALTAGPSVHAAARREPSPISIGPGSKLVYAADAVGNRIPDFSFCGYAEGQRAIPNVPVRVVVAPLAGDSTARIQKAINYVSSLPLDTNGVRGAVLLLKGQHQVFGGLQIAASGVILRGQGMDEGGTVLVASGQDRRTLIRILGRNDGSNPSGKSWQIKDDYVPVGAMSFHLEDPNGLKPGDTIRVIRPSTQAWIDRLGMTEFGGGIGDWRLVWKPGSRDLVWDRTVKSVEAELLTVDAPITTGIEK